MDVVGSGGMGAYVGLEVSICVGVHVCNDIRICAQRRVWMS